MAAARYRRHEPGRDPYPMRIAIVTMALLILLVGALLWAALGGDDGVRVVDATTSAPAAAELRESTDDPSAPGRADGGAGATAPGDRRAPAETDGAARASIDSGPPAGSAPQAERPVGAARAQPNTARAPSSADSSAARSEPSRTGAPNVQTRPAGAERVAAPAPAAASPGRREPPAVTLSRTNEITSAMVADALHREGVYRLETGAFPEAVDRLGRAVELSPLHAVYRNNYGWALFEAGDIVGAATQLERSIRLGPERAIPYANLAEVRLAQGDTGSALAAYLRFLELNDDPALERDANRRIAEIRR